MDTKRDTILWRQGWMLLSTIGMGVVITWLVTPAQLRTSESQRAAPPKDVTEAVRIDSGGAIEIAENSPLQTHLTRVHVELERIRFPALTVSGSILARVTPGSGDVADRWQFSSTEMAGKYADWQKAKGEVDFSNSQLKKTRQLVDAQTKYLDTIVERMRPVAKTGAVSEKEFQGAQAEQIKAKLQGEKDIFTAESAERIAQQSQIALERDLAQGGIEAEVFDRAVEHLVLVAANVPETKISQAHQGQECVIDFYAFPGRPFNARVTSLSSLLMRERRIIRVLIELENQDGELRTGMFADVGLGTGEREAIRIPAEALLHYKIDDYVVVAAGEGKWKPVVVRVGEQHAGAFEVLEGLRPGETIITDGAILLKPAVIQALRRSDRGKS
jgi:cobalt-zinc-cadmium efflux system membrane fusion protein